MVDDVVSSQWLQRLSIHASHINCVPGRTWLEDTVDWRLIRAFVPLVQVKEVWFDWTVPPI